MKKLLLSLLLIPFLLVGCKNNGKKSETKTDQYINVVVDEVSMMEEETYQIQTELMDRLSSQMEVVKVVRVLLFLCLVFIKSFIALYLIPKK